MLAVSMFLVLYSGQLSLAAPGFALIGAYTSVLMDLYWHTPFVVNVIAGTLLAGAGGFLSGLPVLRLRGVFPAIATIGFIEALRLGVVLNLPITDRKSTRLNSSHPYISYAVFCLKKKKI